MLTKMLSAEERFALGEQRRKAMRRMEHAAWDAGKRRESPLKLLAASMAGRVSSLVALKYERMAASPFGYFRGAVPVMAYDFSVLPNTEMTTQLCGDAHVRNLGAYAGPDGRLVFDINDFDETIAGPFEWDVKRMATSLMLAGREAGAKNVHCREAAAVFLERYRMTMWELSRMAVLEVGRYQVHRLRNVAPVSGILRMAERATPLHTLEVLTEPVASAAKVSDSAKKKKGAAKHREKGDGKQAVLKASARRFKAIKPVLTRVTGLVEQQVLDSLAMYAECLEPQRQHLLSQYRPLDVAFKVVGTGSVGMRDYVIYMQGNGPKDPLFLQVKEEAESGYAQYVGAGGRRSKEHQGRRVVEGERAMQVQSDPFLGWTTIDGREYLVRQLNDHKASIEMADLTAAGLMEYAGVCGELLARGHARSGSCSMLAGYLGTSDRFDAAVGRFAEAYADQTEKDWKELVRSRQKRVGKRTAGKG
jgi:uncharacterized protein (DUF2252 family)